jgi:hypothetical protein
MFLPVRLSGADGDWTPSIRAGAAKGKKKLTQRRQGQVEAQWNWLRQKRKEDAQMEETSLQGPVLKVNGKLTLMIPLDEGGAEFVDCSRGISEVEGACLKIAIPEWLAGMLRIDEGDIVSVSNWDGKLQIQPYEAKVVQ